MRPWAVLVDPGAGADVGLELSGVDASDLTIGVENSNIVFSLADGDGWDATLDDDPMSPFTLRNGDMELVVDSGLFADLQIAFFNGSTYDNNVSQSSAISIDDLTIGDNGEAAGAVTLSDPLNDFTTIGIVSSGPVEIVDVDSVAITVIDAGSEAVSITSLGGSIDDADVSDETTANISASDLTLNASGGIGAVGDADIDTAVSRLDVSNSGLGEIFVSNTGALELTDLDGDSALGWDGNLGGGGQISASSPLSITSDYAFAGSMSFVAGDSNAVNDDLTINATVSLDAAADSTLSFVAGDDVAFGADGLISTDDSANDSATHIVSIIADNEGDVDGDRGSITQAGSSMVVDRLGGTLDLQLFAYDGIGDSSNDAGTTRNNAIVGMVDTFTAQNSGFE